MREKEATIGDNDIALSLEENDRLRLSATFERLQRMQFQLVIFERELRDLQDAFVQQRALFSGLEAEMRTKYRLTATDKIDIESGVVVR